MTQSTNWECGIALTLAVIELEKPTLSEVLSDYEVFHKIIFGSWSSAWFIDPSLPLWNNIQEVKYPQDPRSEPK